MLNKKKEKKQNGLLFYSPLKNEESAFFNLGDCIQSLAAKQFFDHIDVYINREETNLYDCSPVKLIMNGWFMHNPYNWPPSDKIQPLFISFHINEYVRSILTSPFSIDYLKQYEPIGCRDINTYKLLNEKGVKAYFSACLTLTLNRTIKNNSSRDIVYIVDPIVDHYINNHLTLKNSFYCLWTLFSHFSFLLKLKRKYSSDLQYTFSFDRIGVKKIINLITFYRIFNGFVERDVLLKAKYVTHVYKEREEIDINSKLELAQEILQKYANARYVITSRIHCALPCLAFETPVIYIQNMDENEMSHCRFGGIVDLFNIVKISTKKSKLISSCLGEKLRWNTIFVNKNTYVKYQKDLLKRCLEFVASKE